MKPIIPVITNSAMLTAYGLGTHCCWRGLEHKKPAMTDARSVLPELKVDVKAGIVPDLEISQRSRLLSMMQPVLNKIKPAVPTDADLILATTTGEIDLLEKQALGELESADAADPQHLLSSVRRALGIQPGGKIVSAACASSSTALTQAAAMIAAGETEAVLVIAGDSVSEFVIAGFASLMALSADCPRPFDRNRDGLAVGEATAAALVMHPARARRENRPVIASIRGWGLTADANHMTGPSRDGQGLTEAIRRALRQADMGADGIRSICAHGTGTAYNDSMEMKAFRRVFNENPVPLYSIKGGTGHTMGAAGLVEILIAAYSLSQPAITPTVGLTEADAEAAGWVSPAGQKTAPEKDGVISTNSGFGGINSCVVLS